MAPNISDVILKQEIQTEEPPKLKGATEFQADPNNNLELVSKPIPQKSDKSEQPLVWRNIVIIAYAHIACVFGVYRLFTSDNRPAVICGK